MQILTHLLLAATIALVLMALTFVLCHWLKFFSLVDAVWALSFSVIALCFGLWSGVFDQAVVFYGIVALWSLRLSAYILARVLSHYPNEDARYTTLKAKWGAEQLTGSARFFLLQGLSIVVLSLPLILVASDDDHHIGALERIAILIWLIGVIGEALSDAQLRAFKMDPQNAGQVCEVGLWRLCRHPNYFFEWIIWCAFGLYALRADFGFLALIAPAFMFYLLNYVSGVPLAEAQSIRSKGERYLAYQRRTNRFFPGVRKS